jgi:SAM-dependent methyltransferase
MRQSPVDLREPYYASFGILRGGELQPTAHLAELVEALGPFPGPIGSKRQALEIGCGVSPYCGGMLAAGYQYTGVDPSAWAASWMQAAYAVNVVQMPIQNWWRTGWGREHLRERYDFVLGAHVIEHLDDGPAALAQIAQRVAPGGELWLVVPDDSDLCNPDHLWFFNETSLRGNLVQAGLQVAKVCSFQRVAHERFIYCRAIQPVPAPVPVTSSNGLGGQSAPESPAPPPPRRRGRPPKASKP